jgi:hypothetical protein
VRGLVLITLLLSPAVKAVDLKHGEILPSAEIQKKYQLSSEERVPLRLDEKRVPDDLRDLIPIVEKWGIADDIIRGDFQSKASQAEKDALRKALTGRNSRITKWLDTFSEKLPMTPEAAAFMYMQLGLDEMGLWVD